MTPNPTAAPATKTKRRDCYVATVKIKIPLDMADAESLGGAINSVKGIEKTLPAGASCEIFGTLGKL